MLLSLFYFLIPISDKIQLRCAATLRRLLCFKIISVVFFTKIEQNGSPLDFFALDDLAAKLYTYEATATATQINQSICERISYQPEIEDYVLSVYLQAP